MRLVPILHGPLASEADLPTNLTEEHIGHGWFVDWACFLWTGSAWFKCLVTQDDANA